MTKSSKEMHLNAVLDAHSSHIERFNKRMNAEPTPDSSASSSKESVLRIFSSTAELLSEQDLTAATAYYNSPTGIKDRAVAEEVVKQFNKATRSSGAAGSGPSDDHVRTAKAEKLITLHGISDTLKGISMKLSISAEEMSRMYISAYSLALTAEELDEAVQFHSSPAGRKCLTSARSSGLSLAKHFGL